MCADPDSIPGDCILFEYRPYCDSFLAVLGVRIPLPLSGRWSTFTPMQWNGRLRSMPHRPVHQHHFELLPADVLLVVIKYTLIPMELYIGDCWVTCESLCDTVGTLRAMLATCRLFTLAVTEETWCQAVEYCRLDPRSTWKLTGLHWQQYDSQTEWLCQKRTEHLNVRPAWAGHDIKLKLRYSAGPGLPKPMQITLPIFLWYRAAALADITAGIGDRKFDLNCDDRRFVRSTPKRLPNGLTCKLYKLRDVHRIARSKHSGPYNIEQCVLMDICKLLTIRPARAHSCLSMMSATWHLKNLSRLVQMKWCRTMTSQQSSTILSNSLTTSSAGIIRWQPLWRQLRPTSVQQLAIF